MADNTSVDLARADGDNAVAASPDLLRATTILMAMLQQSPPFGSSSWRVIKIGRTPFRIGFTKLAFMATVNAR